MGDWWKSFFDETYAEFGLRSNNANQDTALASTIEFLSSVGGLSSASRVFDQCAGVGRIALPFALRVGCEVIGVEQSDNYVLLANEDSARLGVRATLHQGDARQYVCEQPCDLAFNWFTSFGYFDDPKDDLTLLVNMKASVRKGGAVVIDFINLPRIFKTFSSASIARRSTAQGEITLIEEPKFHPHEGVIRTKWTYLKEDRVIGRNEIQVRAYMPHDFVRMFKNAGLQELELFGGTDRSALNQDSKRCIIVGRKPR